MANARLIALELERFKSYAKPTRVDVAPLTVILGRNNSGKSTIIQALLLLKQTLALPRTDVPLHLEGMVDALSLRELTFGWPSQAPDVPGPTITLRWNSTVDVNAALELTKWPDLTTLASNAGLKWLLTSTSWRSKPLEVTTALTLNFSESAGRTVLSSAQLSGHAIGAEPSPQHSFTLKRGEGGRYTCHWDNQLAFQLQADLDHFLPYALIDRRNVGARDRQRSWHNAFTILFAEPLEDLKQIITKFAYLGSIRTIPQTLYRPATVPPESLGVSGEYAAQMLHARQGDRVHYLPPLKMTGGKVVVPENIRARPLVDAVNDVLRDLGVETPLKLEDVKDVGFRMLFGQASLQHVGRGLSYLLPVIQLGLVSDPLRFQPGLGDTPLGSYLAECSGDTHCGLEEPEAHLHPKLQTMLAHWLVALAMSGRRLLVETHSDHLVRRLRGMIARADKGSPLEKWLIENVRILEVEQDGGESRVEKSTLTPDGGLVDHWPADFIDEAADEERGIYHASLDKADDSKVLAGPLAIEHDAPPEPDPD